MIWASGGALKHDWARVPDLGGLHRYIATELHSLSVTTSTAPETCALLLCMLLCKSMLNRPSTELIVSPKKGVGCRGGSRNVEGYLILSSIN